VDGHFQGKKAHRTSWAMQNDLQDEFPIKKLGVLGELCER
jgi:hypothetical protein